MATTTQPPGVGTTIQVLLVRKVLVRGDKHVESCGFRSIEQIAIRECIPSRLASSFHPVPERAYAMGTGVPWSKRTRISRPGLELPNCAPRTQEPLEPVPASDRRKDARSHQYACRPPNSRRRRTPACECHGTPTHHLLFQERSPPPGTATSQALGLLARYAAVPSGFSFTLRPSR